MKTLAAALVCGAWLASGCGGEPAPPATHAKGAGGRDDVPRRLRVKEIAIERGGLKPRHVYVRAGTPLAWKNRDDVARRVVSRPGARQRLRSGSIAPGERFTTTATRRGKTRYRVVGAGRTAAGEIVVY